MNKRRPGGMGASSILMIFVVLALTTFGILSFLSARADLRLTERAADHTVAYYKADRDVYKRQRQTYRWEPPHRGRWCARYPRCLLYTSRCV